MTFFFLDSAALWGPPTAAAAAEMVECGWLSEALKVIAGKLTPMRVPSVVLLSWKKDPVDYENPKPRNKMKLIGGKNET